MAHECFNCGAYCTCNGDWDDIDFGVDINCRHDCDEDDSEYARPDEEVEDGGNN